MKYEVIIFWSKDHIAFIAEVLERAGCMPDGKTPEAALKAVHRVMKEWVQTAKKLGRPNPEPRGRLLHA